MKNFLMTIFVCLIAFYASAQNKTKRTYVSDLRSYNYDTWVIKKGITIEFSDSTTGVVKLIRKYKENNNKVVYIGVKLGKEVVEFDIQKEIANGYIKTPEGVNKIQSTSNGFYTNEGNISLDNSDSLISQVKFLSMRVSELDNRVRLSGIAFQKYQKYHSTGIMLSLLGTVLTVGGMAAGSPIGGAIVGGGVSLVGLIMTLTAPIHIKRAGIVLSGNGIAMPINYR
jgi:hypothetical protein